MPEQILIADADPQLREFLAVSLQAHGYRVLETDNALDEAQEHEPDAIVLDWALNGLEITRNLREWTSTPILGTSVNNCEETLVSALDAGADDFLTKPFRMREFLARLRAALRRKPGFLRESVLQCGPITLDRSMRLVTVHGRPTSLTPSEFGILHQLMLNPGQIVSHRKLLRAVWGEAQALDHHLLRVHVSNLRKKTVPTLIVNEPGLGYRISA